MRDVQAPVRQDYQKRFPRTFVVGREIHTTENGKFVMYMSGAENLALRDFSYKG